MNTAELKSEITNDPAGLGYAGKSPGAQSDLIDARSFPGMRPFTYGGARRWASSNGILIRAVRRAEDAAETDEVLASICRGFLDVPRDTMLDPNQMDISSMVSYLHSLGFFGATYGASDTTNDARRDEFLVLGGDKISRAEQLWGVGTSVPHTMISEAMQA